jgi:hypothetical protein
MALYTLHTHGQSPTCRGEKPVNTCQSEYFIIICMIRGMFTVILELLKFIFQIWCMGDCTESHITVVCTWLNFWRHYFKVILFYFNITAVGLHCCPCLWLYSIHFNPIQIELLIEVIFQSLQNIVGIVSFTNLDISW